MKIYSSFEEMYQDLRGKLPEIKHPAAKKTEKAPAKKATKKSTKKDEKK